VRLSLYYNIMQAASRRHTKSRQRKCSQHRTKRSHHRTDTDTQTK